MERFACPFEWPPDSEFSRPSDEDTRPTPTVFFITDEEFASLSVDLEALVRVAGNVHSTMRHDEVAGHEAVRFIDERILASPWLRSDDAGYVGRVG